MKEQKYTPPYNLPVIEDLPSFWDAWLPPEAKEKGLTPAELAACWNRHKDIIRDMYAHYMYGPMPDTSGETLTYELDTPAITEVILDDSYPCGGLPFRVRKINGTIYVSNEEGQGRFSIILTLPEEITPGVSIPIYSEMSWMGGSSPNADYAAFRGYAAVSWKPGDIASDNQNRDGIFYRLYPYGWEPDTQTGVLMAWSWGAGKILDALEQGMGRELSIDSTLNILSGVSRYGKATAVAGAFDERITVVVPACSGAGGMASFRFPSQGKTYDLSSVGYFQNGSSMYTMSQNEPLHVLLSPAERHWFNDTVLKFPSAGHLPFDQHFLAALMASEKRHLFIVAGHNGEDWTNPPAMAYTYLAARDIYRRMGLEDHINIHIHENNVEPSADFGVRRGPCPNHAVLAEDMVYLLDYCDYHLLGKKDISSDLSDLKTCAFFEEVNWDSRFDPYKYLLQPQVP